MNLFPRGKMLPNQRMTRALAQRIREVSPSSMEYSEDESDSLPPREVTENLAPLTGRNSQSVEHRQAVREMTRGHSNGGTQTLGRPKGQAKRSRGPEKRTEYDVEPQLEGDSQRQQRLRRAASIPDPARGRLARAGRTRQPTEKSREAGDSQEESGVTKRGRYDEDMPTYDNGLERVAPERSTELLLRQLHQQGELLAQLISERPHTQTLRVKSVPEYDPTARKMTTSQWINSLEQFQKMFGWNEMNLIYHMQSGLRGVARDWYDNLREYPQTWAAWTKTLLRTFPEPKGHVLALERMKARTKRRDETYEVYYFAKLNLLRPCNLTPGQEVDHIIEGITDRVVRCAARGQDYATPEELYQRCLLKYTEEDGRETRHEQRDLKCHKCGKVGHIARKCRSNEFSQLKKESDLKSGSRFLQRDQGLKPEGKARGEKPFPNSKPHDGSKRNEKHETTCFNCNDKTHRVADCPKPKKQCTLCKWYGHTSESCKRAKDQKPKIEVQSKGI